MEPVLWFGWFRADIIAEYAVLFWRGLLMTVGVTVICIVQGTALGLLIGMARLAGCLAALVQGMQISDAVRRKLTSDIQRG